MKKFKRLSVLDVSERGRVKYSLRDVPFISYDCKTAMLLEGNNRILAERDILLCGEIIRAAIATDSTVPLCNIYSDDIRFEGSDALNPDEYCHLYVTSKEEPPPLHFFVTATPDINVYGEIIYNGDGDEKKYTVNILSRRNVVCIIATYTPDGIKITQIEHSNKVKEQPYRDRPIAMSAKTRALLIGSLLIGVMFTYMGCFIRYGTQPDNSVVIPDIPEAIETAYRDGTKYNYSKLTE